MLNCTYSDEDLARRRRVMEKYRRIVQRVPPDPPPRHIVNA